MRDVELERKAFEASSTKTLGQRNVRARAQRRLHLASRESRLGGTCSQSEERGGQETPQGAGRVQCRDTHPRTKKRFYWVNIKSFDESNLTYQYEREYANSDPGTATRVKVRRIPVEPVE